MRKINRIVIIFLPLFVLTGVVLISGGASASCNQDQQSCSTDYGVGEYFFGSGGSLDTTCSTDYCAAQTLGETGEGLTSSANYQSYAGFEVNRVPSLEIIVNTPSVNMGVLSTTSAATGTATFSVESYLSSGYVVITDSPAPQYGSHSLNTSSSPFTASAGTEQFGINLADNTSPTSFGAAPVQVPSSSYSYGSAASGYNTPNEYAYLNGATIADSTKSTGQTNYTISYLINISNVTPAGQYVMNQVLIATATF